MCEEASVFPLHISAEKVRVFDEQTLQRSPTSHPARLTRVCELRITSLVKFRLLLTLQIWS